MIFFLNYCSGLWTRPGAPPCLLRVFLIEEPREPLKTEVKVKPPQRLPTSLRTRPQSFHGLRGPILCSPSHRLPQPPLCSWPFSPPAAPTHFPVLLDYATEPLGSLLALSARSAFPRTPTWLTPQFLWIFTECCLTDNSKESRPRCQMPARSSSP